MTKLKSRFTKIISSILGFFGIMTFTSCYGMPPTVMYGVLPNYAVTGCVKGDTDGDNDIEPVKGIHVVLKAKSSSSDSSEPGEDIISEDKTDENGKYYVDSTMPFKGDYIIEFIDEDGAENGEFENESKTVTFIGEDYEEKEVDIELKPKKNAE